MGEVYRAEDTNLSGEVFHRSGDKLMVVSVQTEPTLSPGRPRLLFEGTCFSSEINPGFQYYDL